MKVHYSGDTHVGLQRQVNQDAYGFSDVGQHRQQEQLLVVCDGMGGHDAGEIASRLGVDTILESYTHADYASGPDLLIHAFTEANQRIYEQGRGNMGTTGVAALLHKNLLYVANVGDSRAYLIHNGEIRQISQDHSFVWEQVAAGVLTREQARFSNYRNMITRALGHRSEVQVDMFTEAIAPGDIVLLATDGLHGLVEDDEIAQIATTMPPEQAVDRLIQLANERGGTDNITVVVAFVEEPGSADTGVLAAEQDDPHTADTQPLLPEDAAMADVSRQEITTERLEPTEEARTTPVTAKLLPQEQGEQAAGGREQGGRWLLLALLVVIGVGGVVGAGAAGLLPGSFLPAAAPTSTPTATATATSTSTPTATATARRTPTSRPPTATILPTSTPTARTLPLTATPSGPTPTRPLGPVLPSPPTPTP